MKKQKENAVRDLAAKALLDQHVERFRAAAEEKRLAVQKEYAGISKNFQYPQKVAKALSEHFNTVRVLLVLDGGYTTIRVEAKEIDRAFQSVEHVKLFEDALDAHWPPAHAVLAFMVGFDTGIVGVTELEELRKENSTLKYQLTAMYRLIGPRGPSFGGWF